MRCEDFVVKAHRLRHKVRAIGRGGGHAMAESEVPADEAPTRPLSAWGAYAAIALCVVWGFNQVAVKLALPGVPPLTQAAIRTLGAAGIVALFALRRGDRKSTRLNSSHLGIS